MSALIQGWRAKQGTSERGFGTCRHRLKATTHESRTLAITSFAGGFFARSSSTLGHLAFILFCLYPRALAQPPVINPQGLVNAATGKSASSVPVAARGSLVSIYGSHFSTTVVTASSTPI